MVIRAHFLSSPSQNPMVTSTSYRPSLWYPWKRLVLLGVGGSRKVCTHCLNHRTIGIGKRHHVVIKIFPSLFTRERTFFLLGTFWLDRIAFFNPTLPHQYYGHVARWMITAKPVEIIPIRTDYSICASGRGDAPTHTHIHSNTLSSCDISNSSQSWIRLIVSR